MSFNPKYSLNPTKQDNISQKKLIYSQKSYNLPFASFLRFDHLEHTIKHIALYGLIFTSLIWALTLFLKYYRSKTPGYYMSFVQLSVFLTFASISPFYHNNYDLLIKLDAFFFVGMLLIFPCIYFYIYAVTKKRRLPLKKVLPHIAPALLFWAIAFPFQYILTAEEVTMYAIDKSIIPGPHPNLRRLFNIEILAKIILVLQSVLYLTKISLLIKDFRERITDYFSNVKSQYFNWIHIFYITFLLALLASFPPLVLGNSTLSNPNNFILPICFGMLSVIFYAISYWADNHKYIDDEDFYIENNKFVKTNPLNNTDLKQKELADKIENLFSVSKKSSLF